MVRPLEYFFVLLRCKVFTFCIQKGEASFGDKKKNQEKRERKMLTCHQVVHNSDSLRSCKYSLISVFG